MVIGSYGKQITVDHGGYNVRVHIVRLFKVPKGETECTEPIPAAAKEDSVPVGSGLEPRLSGTASLSCSNSGVPKFLDCGSGQGGSTALDCGNVSAHKSYLDERPNTPRMVSSGRTGLPEVVNFKEISVPTSLRLGENLWCSKNRDVTGGKGICDV